MKRAISKIYAVLLCIGIVLMLFSVFTVNAKIMNPTREASVCSVTETRINEDVREFYVDMSQLEPESNCIQFFLRASVCLGI